MSWRLPNTIIGAVAKGDKCYERKEVQDFYKRLCHLSYEALSKYGKVQSWLSNWWNGFKNKSENKRK